MSLAMVGSDCFYVYSGMPIMPCLIVLSMNFGANALILCCSFSDMRVINSFMQKLSELSSEPFDFPTIVVGTGTVSSIYPSITNAFIHSMKVEVRSYILAR